MRMMVVPGTWLERVMDAALAARGMQEGHRREVVAGVLFGSLRGVDSHGVALFRTYLRELQTGRARACPQFEYRQRRSAITRLDAGHALGIVAGFEATRRAASLARTQGVGVVVVVNSNHFGAASIFTTQLAGEGFVGLAMTNSDALVVPAHGRAPRLGTNPISMAAQGEGTDLFCTDFATSQGSFLRSRSLCADGKVPPAGVLVDGEGVDVATSRQAPAALLPLGGHKGQCLGMMVSILCAVLGEGPSDWELVNLFEAALDEPRQVSHLILAIDVEAVTGARAFRARLSRYLEAFRSAPAARGLVVSCPGDVEAQTAAERACVGIPIAHEDFQFFGALSRELGVAQPSSPFSSAETAAG